MPDRNRRLTAAPGVSHTPRKPIGFPILISGYVHGLLASAEAPREFGPRANQLLQPLLDQEDLALNDTWQYWWGLGRRGWTSPDAISMNTPEYVGYNGLAHITYRSMDAMAILRLASIMPSSVDTKVILNIRKLVASGRLLPFVNQDLIRVGGIQKLESSVALYHARSSAPWELQSQVFALEALTNK